MDINLRLYKKMLLIRKFEERLMEEFSTGRIFGTTHVYLGQEADAAGIFDVTHEDDIVFSNHRCHGHFLAYGGDPYLLAAEIMGKETGLVGGRGGSQHIHWKNFYSFGIQGGIVPIATGMAFAEKILKSNRISLVFLGDGTLGQGVVYESFNFAALKALPVLFVIENNHYAQTTPVEKALAGSINDRSKAFGILTWECETTDVLKIRKVAEEAIDHVRKNVLPGCLVISTYRFGPHSKGDDYRDPSEIARYRQDDPLIIQGNRINPSDMKLAEEEIADLIQAIYSKAIADPSPIIERNYQLT